MRLLSRPASMLVAILSLGLAIGCAPSTPESDLNSDSAPPAVTSEAESPSPAESPRSTTEDPSTTETAPAADTATAPAEDSPTTQAVAAKSIADEPAAVFAEGGVAIRGADPVAYFEQGAYVAGSSEYTYDWGGATWQFANAEHRDLFVSNPGQYAPQYGGFCAWAVSEGYTAPVDPTAWDIVDGKLYLNFNASIQNRWQRDVPGHIARANQNWPGVLDSDNP